jgi:hypothetical protein
VNKHRFTLRNSQGFTLMEVALFLAISGALVAIAVAGLAPRLRNVRFTSSVRGVETTIDKEFSTGASFENVRTTNRSCSFNGTSLSVTTQAAGSGNAAGATGTCIIAGKAMRLSANTITILPILALKDPHSSCSNPDNTLPSLLACYKPIVHDNANETITAKYSSGLTLTSIDGQKLADRTVTTGFGYIIHPRSGQRYIIQLTKSGPYQALFSGSITSSGALTAQTAYSTPLCFALDSRKAELTFNNLSLKPTTNFNMDCV